MNYYQVQFLFFNKEGKSQEGSYGVALELNQEEATQLIKQGVLTSLQKNGFVFRKLDVSKVGFQRYLELAH